MVIAASLATLALRGLPETKPARLLAFSSAALIGAAVYLGVQIAWRAPELGWLKDGLIGKRLPARFRR